MPKALPTAPEVPLVAIYPHESNPRYDATADEAMVASITQTGLLEPLLVAPHASIKNAWTLVDGHRRLDGCQRAGLKGAPVTVRYDLVTEAQQIEAMIVTGLQKRHLSPVEEARGYEQLTLLGMDEESIAAATGFSRRHVASRTRLNQLPTAAKTRLHDGTMTLLDAEALLEFADDPAATAKLELALGTSNFTAEANFLRSERGRRKQQQDIVATFSQMGAKLVDHPEGMTTLVRFRGQELREPDAHADCLGYVVPESSFVDPYLVCRTPASHDDTAPAINQPPAESEWEKGAPEREAARAREHAASGARLTWMVEHLAGLLGGGQGSRRQALVPLARALVPTLLHDADVIDPDTWARACGEAPASYADTEDLLHQHAGDVEKAPAPLVIDALARTLSVLVETELAADLFDDLPALQHQNTLWEWLAGASYPMSDTDLVAAQSIADAISALTAKSEAS